MFNFLIISESAQFFLETFTHSALTRIPGKPFTLVGYHVF